MPGRANAYPAVAAMGRFVAVVWGAAAPDGATDLYVAVSRDAGQTFGSPRLVNDAATTASLAAEQPPRVAVIPREGSQPAIVVVWTSKAPAGTRLLTARSDDGGRSFSRAIAVPGSEAAGNRGWESTATDGRGRVVALWLDHRELARPADGAASTRPAQPHQHGAADGRQTDGAARAQLSKLFFAPLDGSLSARAITGGVCYCCKTTLAAGRGGDIYAAWRHVYPGNVRDIAIAVSHDGGRTFSPPARVSEDNWVLDGCPENGPSLAVDAGGRVHVVWPTLVPGGTASSEPAMSLFYATSGDGIHFSRRQALPAMDFPRHAELALDAQGRIVAAWEEQGKDARRVVVARGTVDRAGGITFARDVIEDAAPASTPAVAATTDGIVVVWTSGAAGRTVLRSTRPTF